MAGVGYSAEQIRGNNGAPWRPKSVEVPWEHTQDIWVHQGSLWPGIAWMKTRPVRCCGVFKLVKRGESCSSSLFWVPQIGKNSLPEEEQKALGKKVKPWKKPLGKGMGVFVDKLEVDTQVWMFYFANSS